MHRPVCIKCNRELRPKKNGILVLDVIDGRDGDIWNADLWECPDCGIEIAVGFAPYPSAAACDEVKLAQEKKYGSEQGLLYTSRQ